MIDQADGSQRVAFTVTALDSDEMSAVNEDALQGKLQADMDVVYGEGAVTVLVHSNSNTEEEEPSSSRSAENVYVYIIIVAVSVICCVFFGGIAYATYTKQTKTSDDLKRVENATICSVSGSPGSDEAKQANDVVQMQPMDFHQDEPSQEGGKRLRASRHSQDLKTAMGDEQDAVDQENEKSKTCSNSDSLYAPHQPQTRGMEGN